MIGNLMMDQLVNLDKVAYIRFASVYRAFEDVSKHAATQFIFIERLTTTVLFYHTRHHKFSAFKCRITLMALLRAVEKRPVSMDQIEQSLTKIKSMLRATGEREVKSEMIGNLMMDQLVNLDKVAYIRFASVYRAFEDVSEFGEAIANLQK